MSVTLNESLLSLKAASKLLPGNPHVATLWRWAQKGCRGAKLETVLVGGIRYTSREALDRFIVATTAAADGTPTPIIATPKQRQRQIDAAKRELAEAGI